MNRIVQTRNPRSGYYIKIDREKGKVIDYKISKGPYKNIPIIRRKNK